MAGRIERKSGPEIGTHSQLAGLVKLASLYGGSGAIAPRYSPTSLEAVFSPVYITRPAFCVCLLFSISLVDGVTQKIKRQRRHKTCVRISIQQTTMKTLTRLFGSKQFAFGQQQHLSDQLSP